MKKACLVVLLALSTTVVAQGPPAAANSKLNAPQSKITVKINGITCNTPAGNGSFLAQAWSWGASNSGSFSVGGGGAGKANIQDLSISKKFDECSPSLFGAVVTGKHLTGLLLTQEDANGIVVATVTLTDVLVSSWSIGSSTASAGPDENVTFNFAKVCVAESAGGSKFCFDIAQNKVF